MPSDDPFPFVIDCATSINQRGKIEKNVRLGLPTAPGQVGDRDGRERTDSAQILKDLQKTPPQAYLAPLGGVGEEMGGYKGYGEPRRMPCPHSTRRRDLLTPCSCHSHRLRNRRRAPLELASR